MPVRLVSLEQPAGNISSVTPKQIKLHVHITSANSTTPHHTQQARYNTVPHSAEKHTVSASALSSLLPKGTVPLWITVVFVLDILSCVSLLHFTLVTVSEVIAMRAPYHSQYKVKYWLFLHENNELDQLSTFNTNLMMGVVYGIQQLHRLYLF